MARGQRVEAGVFYYNDVGAPSNTKGKRHPSDIDSGLETTSKINGSTQEVKPQSGGGTHFPNVSKENGVANLGTSVSPQLGKGVGGAPGGTASSNGRLPGGVINYDGTKAKNSISAP